MEKVEERILLYYPSIIIEDDDEHGQWIRNALLYWDKIATINPGQDFVNQYYEKNPLTYKSVLSYLKELGVYEEIKPGLLAYNSDLSKAFKEEIKEVFSSNEARKNIYNPEKLTNRRKIKLHKTKLENILDFLRENKIVIENESDIWFDMDRNDADIFMSILAKYLAKVYSNEKRYVDIGTDISKDFLKPFHLDEDNKIKNDMYISMMLQDILPCPCKETSIHDHIGAWSA